MCVGGTEPTGEADPARNGIQFAHDKTVLGQDEVGSQDTRDVGAEGFLAGEGDEFLGFSPVEEFGNPRGLFACDGEGVEVVAGVLEEGEAVAEGSEFVGEFFGKNERVGRKMPLLFGEQSLGRERGPECVQRGGSGGEGH